ncbi:MAG: hypothetical protein IKE28_04430 [Solobacterium sp.]|nr:hypothetical protein [Solobacterium sp.]
MRDIALLKKKRFSYKDIIDPQDDYNLLGQKLEELIKGGKIRPNKSSGRVSFQPHFYNEYFVNTPEENMTENSHDIQQLAPILLEYYISHASHFEEDRQWLLPLSEWMKCENQTETCSVKERSYEIFRNEKILESSDLRRIMNRCGFGFDDLQCYRTFEPFFCTRISSCGAALVLENKDPWYSICRALKTKNTNRFLNTELMYVIYGEGRKVNSTAVNSRLKDFIGSLEQIPESILYCGDIDRAGVSILTKCQEVNSDIEVLPFTKLYQAMIDKAPENVLENEPSEDRKTKNYEQAFSEQFSKSAYVRDVLENNLRIPQEILTYADYLQMCGDAYV